jgi:putative transcription factor
MECEICGKTIVGKRYKVILEGSELTVCENCKELGVLKPTTAPKTTRQRGIQKVGAKRVVKSRDMFEYELVEDFHKIIKREREKRGWSQEELAKRIQEKVTLIKKIENAELTPEKDVVEKLERVLNVKLKEIVEDVKVERGKSVVPTLGDIVVIKRKR